MSESYPIRDDHECIHCYYNLRGLTLDHNCPECGRPVLDSLRLVIRPPAPRTREELAEFAERGAQLRAAIKGSEYPVEAFSFMLGAIRYALLRQGPGGGGAGAREICDAVRDYGRLRLNGESGAVRRLGEWKIHRSEDVGRIIFRMAETGRVRLSPGDTPEEFAGLFTLENLFDRRPA
jgi:uncharacterized repeat protein (TIGR04138 family)